MTGPDTTVESWDTQIITRAVVEGVFMASKIETALDKPRYKKGHMYETRNIDNIDERSAGFIDYVGTHGTLADKVAVASAVARCTSMGRMSSWDADINKLWLKFDKTREYLANFTNLPGNFVHHEANVYDLKPEGPYDLVVVDPPKVVSATDVYSVSYAGLNRALGGKCEIPSWSWRDVPGRLRRIFEIPTNRLILMYTSDVRPTVDDMRALLSQYGEIVEDRRFLHRSRYDYGIVVQKNRIN
jgi:hypothetical protein